jgi:ABC-type phosphate transport system, periplasmic component
MRSLAKAVSLAVVLCLGLTETGTVEAETKEAVKASPIRISGAQTMLGLTRRLTEWSAGRNKRVDFRLEGGHPTQGFTALIESKAEIAQSARKALDGEIGALRARRKLEFVEIPVATEFAVIAVNAANPVHAISLYDLRMVLSGQIKN